MKTELRERRNRAAGQHDAALASYPTREGAEFRRKMQAVVDELSTIAKAADVPSSDPVEVAKTYRWLGDACFDLGQSKDSAVLALGARAYDRAEQLLADADAPVEMAKLNFNYGNTLRGLSQGFDVALLEAAQTRYESAAKAFRSHNLPDLTAMVDQQLRSIDPQLRLARKRSELEHGQKRLADLMEKAKTAGAVEREAIAQELERLKEVRQRGAVGETLEEAMAAIEEQSSQHADRSGDSAGKVGSLQEDISAMKAILETASSERSARDSGGADAEILRSVPEQIQNQKEEMKVSDDVRFTVYRPRVVRPQRWYRMLAFAHLAEAAADQRDPQAEVEGIAKAILGEEMMEGYDSVREDSSGQIPFSGELTFVPEIDGVEFKPRWSSFRWANHTHFEKFDFRASGDINGKVARGRMSVFLHTLLIAEINLRIRVDSAHVEAQHMAHEAASAGQFQRIFPSYSHKDTSVVDEIETSVQTLGHRYLRDVTTLRSGEEWQPRLMKLIEEADVFQLFWSWNAIDSEIVEKEWRYALSLARKNFVRPLYWQAPFPRRPDRNLPPPALERLHFTRFPSTHRCLEASDQEIVPAVSPSTPSTAGSGHSEQDILRQLQERLQKEKREGKISGDRADQLAGILKQFGETMSGKGEDLKSMSRRVEKMRQLTQQVMDKAMSPSWSTPDPEPASRAHALVSVLDPLNRHLLAEKGRGMQPTEETSAATDLLVRLPMLEMRIREAAKDDKRIAELEGEVWRLALEVQEHARRHHLILAQPVFAMGRTHAKPQSLFLSGDDELLRIAEALTIRHDLELFSRPRRGDYAQERWNQLCSASMAVFDLRVAKGKALAQVCYELGLALALGKPSIVVAPLRGKIPFDVNLQTISLSGKAAVDQLDRAILTALSSVVWGGPEAGLGQGTRDALAWLDRRFGPRLSEGTLGIARRLAAQSRDDAIAFRRSLGQLLGMLGAEAPVALLPAWPPAYPDSGAKPRCFHVMPFRKQFEPTREFARAVCADQGWHYSRGDEATEQRIIRGIWMEIARASAVLVDITGHNANVALELGLVHALGRPYRVVSQDPPEEAKFPSLEKVQIHRYEGAPGFGGFANVVNELVKPSSST